MQVILLENIRKLGRLGDKVNVKPGFGRNYLIPQKKAAFATEKNLKQFEERRAEFEKNAQLALAAAQQRAVKLNDITLTITAMASEEGKLYGSVGIHEIRDALKDRDIEIGKNEILMPNGSIHSVGQYDIEIQLHSEVQAMLKVDVVSGK